MLLSYLKVAIFEPRLRTRTTFVLKSCDFQAPAAKVDLAKVLRVPSHIVELFQVAQSQRKTLSVWEVMVLCI